MLTYEARRLKDKANEILGRADYLVRRDYKNDNNIAAIAAYAELANAYTNLAKFVQENAE